MDGNRQKSVKVLDHKPGTGRRSDLYGILGKHGIYPGKMHAGQGVFFPIIKESEIEEMLKEEVRQEAGGNDFEIVTPIEFGALQTIVVREVDSMIEEYNVGEIAESIQCLNEWAEVVEVYKFATTSKLLKVRFKSTSMVQRALKDGLIILNQRVPARRVEREIFVKITPCYNCYAYDHDQKNCPKEKMTLCAFCSEEGHKQGACKRKEPKCINCGEGHKTLAAQCKIRKDLIKGKRKEIRDRSRDRSRSRGRNQTRAAERVEGATYADRVSAGTRSGPMMMTDENKDIMTIIMSAIVYSHYMETIIPGSFQSNMDLIYKENGLKPIKFPKHTPMGNFVDVYSNVLKQQLVDDQPEQGVGETGDEEAFEDVDMELMTSKRGRESSTSPGETKDQKKKREEESRQQSHVTLTLPPQEKPPMPPPPRPPAVRQKKEKERSQDMTEEISRRVREERLQARERSHSQSSVSSSASGGHDIKSAKEMAITIHVPNTETNRRIFSTPLNKEKKEVLARSLMKGNAKLTWEPPSVKRETLLLAIQRKQVPLDTVRFRMTSMEEYMHLNEGSRKAKTTS